MSGRTPAVAIKATFHAKKEKKQEFWDFLAGAKDVADKETDTLQWFGYKLDDSPDGELGEFGIFDTFPSTVGRDAHVNGDIPKALNPKIPEFLAKPPTFEFNDVIASKISSNAASEGKLPKWAMGTITAKAESAAEVKSVLTGSYASAIREESFTNYWFAFQISETVFGLCGAWPSEKDRADHLAGPAVADMIKALSPLSEIVVKKGETIAQKLHG